MSRIGGKVLELNNVFKSFGDIKLIENFSYIFKKGERAGILGKNGSGKTTLLNLITGNLSPDMGKISTGQTIVFGYYSQEGFQPKEDKRVIEIAKEIAEQIPFGKRSICPHLPFYLISTFRIRCNTITSQALVVEKSAGYSC